MTACCRGVCAAATVLTACARSFVVDAAWRPVSYVTSQDILQAVAGATDERMDMHEHDRG